MINTTNNYPIVFGKDGIIEPRLEKLLRRALWAIIHPIFPEYIERQREYFSAPKLRLDEIGLYGLVLWRLPEHIIYWGQMKSFYYEGNRVFILDFEAKNMLSSYSKDRVSKIRISVPQRSDVEVLGQALMKAGLQQNCID